MVLLRFHKMRIIKIANILIDYTILFWLCINNFSLLNNIFSNYLNLFSSIGIIVFINYLIGKYDFFNLQNIKKIIFYFLKKNIISLIYIFIIFLFFSDQFITYYLCFLFIVYFLTSLSLQLVLLLFAHKFRFWELRLNIYGSEEETNSIKDIFKSFNYSFRNKNLTLIRVNDDFSKIGSIDHLVISDKSLIRENNFLEFCVQKGVKIYSIEEWIADNFKLVPFEKLNKINMLKLSSNSKKEFFYSRIKRLGDIVLSSFLIVFLFPILLTTFFLILIDDGLPLFYGQVRSGKNGKEIKILKLRTMFKDAEKKGARWAISNDERVTKVGSFLRKFRIDELPQLISVLKGEMSLIGPRPERPLFDKEIMKHIPNYKLRLFCKPGLSGWAQVNYPYGASIEDSKKKFTYDAYYILYSSFKLDLIILIKTIKLILSGKGSEPRDILN